MPRFLGILLIALILAPRVPAVEGLAARTHGDDRAAAAVVGNVEHFALSGVAELERSLDRGATGRGNGPSARHSCADFVPTGGVSVRVSDRMSAARHECRPHSERLPYHANAPPSGRRAKLTA